LAFVPRSFKLMLCDGVSKTLSGPRVSQPLMSYFEARWTHRSSLRQLGSSPHTDCIDSRYLHNTARNLKMTAAAGAVSEAAVQSCRLIAQQDWDALRNVLSTESGKEALRTGIMSLGIDGALHFTCRFHPPLDVIVSIADFFPGSVLHCDKAGRYPLHIACKWGASPLVLRFLVEEEPSVCAIADETGKTPLHHVCRSYGQNYSACKNGGRSLTDALHEIVRGLCKASPDTVNLEDEEDTSALEYAIESDLNMKVVRTIQKACEKDWKSKREQCPGFNHDDIRRKLLIEAQRNAAYLNKQLSDMSQAALSASMSALYTGYKKLPPPTPTPPTVRVRKAKSCAALSA